MKITSGRSFASQSQAPLICPPCLAPKSVIFFSLVSVRRWSLPQASRKRPQWLVWNCIYQLQMGHTNVHPLQWKPHLQDKTPTATDWKDKNNWTWMIKYLSFLYNLVMYIIFRWLWGSLAPPMAPSALDAPCPGPEESNWQIATKNT